MKQKRIVIALGHDALGITLPDQKKATQEAAKAIADLVQDDCEIVITHSNGPQVGMIHMAMSELQRHYPEYTATPMSVVSAMSQGYIGYDLQNAIRAELVSRGVFRTVSTILTQVTVDTYDDAFYNPTKVIGRTMNAEEADAEERKGNHVCKTDNGFRRIVAAPIPQQIIELEAITTLMDAGQIVIAAGGGGIPVLEQGVNLKGASAVIEKDSIAGLLAEGVNAERLIILTGVDCVYKDFGKEKQEALNHLTVDEAHALLEAGQFEEGTMKPKIETALKFIGDSDERQVLITKLDCIKAAIAGQTGTVIRK